MGMTPLTRTQSISEDPILLGTNWLARDARRWSLSQPLHEHHHQALRHKGPLIVQAETGVLFETGVPMQVDRPPTQTNRTERFSNTPAAGSAGQLLAPSLQAPMFPT